MKSKIVLGIIGLMTLMIFNANAQGPEFEWAKNMGGGPPCYAYGVAADAQGNVYVTGYFNGTADLDPGNNTQNFTSNGQSDVYVVKLDASGSLVWARQMGGTENEQAFGISVDADGNVYTTGYFSGTVDFDPGTGVHNLTASGSGNVFISKLDSTGAYVWAKRIGSSAWSQASSIALDDSGNVYVDGFFQGMVDFDPGTGTEDLTSHGGFDVFVLKLNANGDYVWAGNMGGSGNDFSHGIAVDKNDNIYACGYFMGTADFDPGADTGNLTLIGGFYDGFICKLNSAGQFNWARQVGGNGIDMVNGLAADKNGNVYATGNFQDTVDFDSGSGVANVISYGGYGDVFLSKYDSSGNFVWAKHMGGTLADYGQSIELDPAGAPVVIGYFNGTTDFDPGNGTASFTSSGAEDVFVCKIKKSGNFDWAKQFSGFGNDYGFSVFVDGAGNVYSAGTFSGPLDFDSGVTLNSDTGGHIFVEKMRCGDTSSSLQKINACGSYTLNGQHYDSSGTYIVVMPNAEGCDSTITIDLTINHITPAVITQNGSILGTTVPYMSYQWILNGNAVPGATGSTYQMAVNGDYRVAVVDGNGCTDTSDVYSVMNLGIINPGKVATLIKVYPNPTKDEIHIQSPVSVDAAVYAPDGRLVLKQNKTQSVSLKSLPEGIYLLKLSNKEIGLAKMEKIVRLK